jgi:hypothetical protein
MNNHRILNFLKAHIRTLKTWLNTPRKYFFQLGSTVLVILFLFFLVFLIFGKETLSASFFAGFITISTWLYVQYRAAERVNWEAIRDYYDEGDDESLIRARKWIHHDKRNLTTEDLKQNGLQNREDAVSKVVNFWEKWGRLVERGYLPLWIFDGPSGDGTTIMLRFLADDIKKRRNDHFGNRSYGRSFVWLVTRIRAKGYLRNWEHNELVDLDNLIKDLEI